MKSPGRTLALTAVVLILAGAVFGQGLLPRKIWSLTIDVNVPGATIFVDNVRLNGNAVRVIGGPHNVTVEADGYFDFSGSVVVTANQTFTVQLQPRGFPLMIRVNVPSATVLIDGADVSGIVPNVSRGSHTIEVTAPGYRPYQTVVNVAAAMSIDVVLQTAGFLLTVNANVPNASVTVNNLAKGGVPYSEYLPPGPYTLRVSAPGFTDYIANISLTRAIAMNVQLQRQPFPPTLSFVIPPAYLDPDMRPGDPRSQVRIYVDDQLVNPRREMERIQVEPGRHRIRVASGAFSIQIGEMDLLPGTSYAFELSMDWKIRTMRSPQ
jgi:hypothetical protein